MCTLFSLLNQPQKSQYIEGNFCAQGEESLKRNSNLARKTLTKILCLDPCILNRLSLFGPHLDY